MKKIRANLISGVTRRNILDHLSMENVSWAGRLDEPNFVVRVWPDAGTYPSTDHRYTDALGDIRQHRVNNYDWDDDWLFTDPRFNLSGCDDDTFLNFLAATVHPVVRQDEAEVTKLVAEYNAHLRADGYALTQTTTISGRPVYGGARISARHTPATALTLPTATLLDDRTALQDHLETIHRTISTDPASTIASAKELLETTFKLILDKRGITYVNGDDLGDLYKKVATELALTREAVPDSAKGSAAAKKTLSGLSTAVFGLAELRNTIGRGHGRTTASPALERHARLAFNTAVAISEFLFDTWHDREQKSAGP